ncbi:MAG: DUF3306 domain-containing protein [Gammaproteobacteria bacterium]|nr:DUF3306 domain-containing protein [Gammaproteobacteria bacterium]
MSKEGFASRWSRMKQQERVEKQLPTAEEEPNTDFDQSKQHEALNQLSDEDMPSLETLTDSSDYSGFLSAKVSEAVRKAALRKMFHLPTFNLVDGLDDYAEDYTNFEALGDIVTHDMKRMAKLDEEREKEKRQKSEEEKRLAQEQTRNDAQIEEETHKAVDKSEVDSDFDDADIDDA